jgi:DNA-binding MarR family transcriptional regulator
MTHAPGIQAKDVLTESMLIAIRRVIRAVDLHSRHLAQSHALTGPQALLMRELAAAGELAPSDLARRVSLSQATVTDIIKRLERRKLLSRLQDPNDRRKVRLRLTESGKDLQSHSPPLLQDTFVSRFADLQPWEQHMLLSTMQRIAALMDAQTLDAAPLLSSDPLDPEIPMPHRRPVGNRADSGG